MKAVEKKQEQLDALVQEFQGAASIYLVNYQGLTVEKDNALRLDMRRKGIKYRAVKNTLLKRALDTMNVKGMENYLIGATSVMIGTAEDPMLPARELVEFHKKNPDFLKVKGISMDGSALPGSELENLSKMPGKKEILAQIVSMILGPGANLVAIFNGPGATLAGQVKSVVEKLETAEVPA